MIIGSTMYTVERTPSAAEQRIIDANHGELARTLASLLRWRRRVAPVVVPDYPPAEWARVPVTSSSVNCPKSA